MDGSNQRNGEGLLAFASEAAPVRITQYLQRWTVARTRTVAVAVAMVGVIGGTALASRRLLRGASTTAGEEPGKVTIEARPTGAAVVLDGTPRGVTPVVLSVKPGKHSVAVRINGEER